MSHCQQIQEIYDVLIIGGGPAGVFCAYLAHIKGLNPLLIEATSSLGGQPKNLYSQKKIYDYPTYYGLKGHEIAHKLVEQLIKHSPVHYLLNITMKNYTYNDGTFNITLSSEQQIKTKAIIIAMGAGIFSPNKLTIDCDDWTNIHYAIQSLDHYQNKRVVILGGGDSAVDWANELIENNISNDVTIIHRRSEFRANGENVLRMRTNKIKIYLDYEIKSIELNKINFISNLDQQTKIIPYDVILVQYGQTISRNNLNVFKNIDVNNVGRIKVQINQMTNLSNIYAIGDICIYEGKASSLICTHGETAVAIRDIINHIRQYDKK